MPQFAVHVGLGGPGANLVVFEPLSGGQFILKLPKSLKHGLDGIGGNDGNVRMGQYGGCGSGFGFQKNPPC